MASVGNLHDPLANARVAEHLRSVDYIVLCQFLGDAHEIGIEANGQLWDFFAENHGALIQADGEGLYKASELVVELK